MARLFIPVKVPDGEIPSLDNLETFKLEQRFGKTPFYLLVDTSDFSFNLLRNQNHHFGGKIHPFQLAETNKADAVLASHMGSPPFKGFAKRNIPVYAVDSSLSVKQALDMFQKGQLSLMEAPEHDKHDSEDHHHH